MADGTLKLWKTDRGLRYRIRTPDTRLGREVVDLIRSGEMGGSSFKFRPRPGGVRELTQFEDFDSGRPVQLLRDVKLIDVGPCIAPAYAESTVWLWSGQ